MKCKNCGHEIDERRLKAIPDTLTCTECSKTKKKIAFRVVESKTEYCKLQFLDEDKAKEIDEHYKRNGYGLPNSMKK